MGCDSRQDVEASEEQMMERLWRRGGWCPGATPAPPDPEQQRQAALMGSVGPRGKTQNSRVIKKNVANCGVSGYRDCPAPPISILPHTPAPPEV